MNSKQIVVIGGAVAIIIAVVFLGSNFIDTSYTNNTNEAPQAGAVVDVVQYHDDEGEVVVVTYYEDSVVVVGAGVGQVTMTHNPTNSQQFFGGDFVLTITGDTAVITRQGQPQFSGRESYDANSWEAMIPVTCQRFFDGCNTCWQGGGCTDMWCAVYDKPRCLDNEISDLPAAKSDEPVTSNVINPDQTSPAQVGQSAGTLTNRAWYWQQTIYEGPAPAGALTKPAVAGRFFLTFGNDGLLQIGTDCNSMGTTYTIAGDRLTISSEIRTTLMYCEGSQEQAFSQMIQTATRYRIEDATLYIYLDDSHVMVLR